MGFCASGESLLVLTKEERKTRKKKKKEAALKAEGELSSGYSSEGEVAAATKKKRPGRVRTLDKLRVPGAFPTHLNLQEWDAQLMNACYQAGGHTDRKEFEWLQKVLDVKEQDMMGLVNVQMTWPRSTNSSSQPPGRRTGRLPNSGDWS